MKYTWIKKEKQNVRPDWHHMIYVEGSYNQSVNNYIQEHLEWIKAEFKERYFDFLYLPEILKDLPDYNATLFYFPHLKGKEKRTLKSIKPQDYYEKFFTPEELKEMGPTIVRYAGYDWSNHCEVYVSLQLELDTEESIDAQFHTIFQMMDDSKSNSTLRIHNHFERDFPMFSFCRDSYEKKTYNCPADDQFPEEARKLLAEIRQKIDELGRYDIRKEILMDLLMPKQRLSRMVITSDYKILLPDYQMEIKLRPLPKAIYLLFLLRPTGIYFKDLSSYREELKSIYKALTNRTNDEAINKALDRVTNPLDNAINENCSVIYQTFREKFEYEIAQHYYIDGLRGEKKRIDLDRSLVSWEAKIPNTRVPASMEPKA